MSKSRIHIMLIIALLGSGAVRSFAQTVPAKQDEAKLIAVLKSADASHKEKVDACRGLSFIGTKNAIAPLAALLGDEKLSHMARYGLEPIPDPAVDEAFRAALGKLKGMPLVGVIGSIGVRRDAGAVRPLTRMLGDSDTEVAQAAAKALGNIANQPATRALQRALRDTPADNQLAVCEGLFRCAEALAAKGRRDVAVEIYDQLRGLKGAHQVRGGALRGAILARGIKENIPRRATETTRQYLERKDDGVTLLLKYLQSDDYIMFSAAAQTALELPGRDVTGALTSGLNGLSADNQILIIQTLGKRGEAGALPALSALVRNAEKPVRIAAMRALPQIEQAEGLVLVPYFDDRDADISKAAKESFAAMQGSATDGIVMKMFASDDVNKRLAALELMGRRRMTDSIPEVLKAAKEPDRRIRPAAIRMLGELGGPAELRTVLDLLMDLEQSADLDAARQALAALAAGSDTESCAAKLIEQSAKARPAQKVVLLRVLSGIGGTNALKAVRGAVDDSDAQVHTAAIRALSSWQNADAAPILLILASKAESPSDKTLCLRGFLGFASRGDLPANSRLSMCRQAADLVERDDEKKLLLGALGSINSPNALAMISPYMDDPATREEASTATVTIADRLLRGRNAPRFAPKLIEPLEKAAKSTSNSDLAGRAKALLQQAKKQRGR